MNDMIILLGKTIILCYGVSFLFYTPVYANLIRALETTFDFCKFVCDNNPLLLKFDDDESDDDEDEEEKEESTVENVVKYEDKYLTRFKTFPNHYVFSEEELEYEKQTAIELRESFERRREADIDRLKNEIDIIQNVLSSLGTIDFTEPISETHKNILLSYCGLEDEYEEYADEISFEEEYNGIVSDIHALETELQNAIDSSITDDKIAEKAHNITIENHLTSLVNNYVVEHTPLGNVYMRYNSAKGSFEYFSNNTIPYRYLETICRRYVMTYWCKPLFVDIEEELKCAEIKYDDELKKKESEEKKKQSEINKNPRSVVARMKTYNKEQPNAVNRPSNSLLPSQLKANIVHLNQSTDKHLLKENANRYTWEGRLANFCPLKKIDMKLVNKSLQMSYADFKKMQK